MSRNFQRKLWLKENQTKQRKKTREPQSFYFSHVGYFLELATILSTDMSTAFDSLCHNLVIKKLKAYGFTNQSLDLIRSFLNDRYSRVKLGSIRSEWSKMSRGCPQGSSFGPLLWNLFQNDMTMLVKDTNLFMYADDHQLYVTGSDYNIASSRLQYQGKLAMSWYRDNFLLDQREVSVSYYQSKKHWLR